jgi:hypothetical protein
VVTGLATETNGAVTDRIEDPMHLCRLFLMASLSWCVAGCDAPAPTSATGPSPQVRQAASYVISGLVAERIDGTSRPLAEAFVGLKVAEPGSLRTESTGTDQNGRYTAQVPRSRVYVWAEGPSEVEQPCVTSAAIDRDTTMPDVELIPARTSARLRSAPRPLITGFVYETSAQGRNPLRGVQAILFQQNAQDNPVAQVEVDDAGRFLLCRVNTPLILVVALYGYEPWSQLVSGTTDLDLEIELRR